MGYLITSTILGAYSWLSHAPASWYGKAQADFLAKLRREDKFEPTPEIQRGLDFESFICENSARYNNVELFAIFVREHFNELIKSDINTPISQRFRAVEYCVQACKWMYMRIHGGQFQAKATKELEVDGEKFSLFGYIDVAFPDILYDIKTTTKFRQSKYTESAQHLVYIACTGIKRFGYLVVDYNGTAYPVATHFVDASCEPNVAEIELRARIREFVAYLKTHDLWQTYTQLFCRGKK